MRTNQSVLGLTRLVPLSITLKFRSDGEGRLDIGEAGQPSLVSVTHRLYKARYLTGIVAKHWCPAAIRKNLKTCCL